MVPVPPMTSQQNVVVVAPLVVVMYEPKYVMGHGLLLVGGMSA
jgi:hypothetical protein